MNNQFAKTLVDEIENYSAHKVTLENMIGSISGLTWDHLMDAEKIEEGMQYLQEGFRQAKQHFADISKPSKQIILFVIEISIIEGIVQSIPTIALTRRIQKSKQQQQEQSAMQQAQEILAKFTEQST